MPDASKPLWLNQEKPKEESKDIFLCVGTPVHSEASIHYTQCVLELQKYFFKQDRGCFSIWCVARINDLRRQHYVAYY